VTLSVTATENNSVTCRISFSVNCEKERLTQKEFFKGNVKIGFIFGSIFIFPAQEIISYYLKYKTSQIQGDSEGNSIFWEVIVLVILRKKFHMNICLILNGF